MLNIIDLESRWLRYKIKSYLPRIIVLSTLIIFMVTLIFFYLDNQKKLTQKETTLTLPEQNISIELNATHLKSLVKEIVQEEENQTKMKTIENTPIIPETNKEVIKETVQEHPTPSRVFAPSMGFMNEMQDEPKPYYENTSFTSKTVQPFTPIEQNYEEEHIEDIIFDTQEEEYVEQEQLQQIEQVKSKKINIKRQNVEEDLAGIIKRFKKSNNPALSLFIAKKYYELNDYHNAYNYALITNDLNRDIEPSWIIFSKSLVKLGKKNQAIKTLQEYISSSKSQSAKILLDEIEAGKFK